MSERNVEKLVPFKAPFSVVSLIETIVPTGELQLIRSYLGESSIEYCHDLRQELDMLLEIWKDVGEQSEPPTITKSEDFAMFDPPNAREMLTTQIKFLTKELHEKNGVGKQLSFTETDEKVIKYVMIAGGPTETVDRPSTPMRKNNPECTYYTSPVKLKQVQRNINVFDIDKVADLIRDAIQKESTALENDIQFLQKCVEEEHDIVQHRPTSPIREPPLSKLREVCKTLESKALAPTALIGTNSQSKSFRNNLKHSTLPKEILPTPCSPIKSKQTTPPSPNKVRLKPLDKMSPASAPNSPLSDKHWLPVRPLSHRLANFKLEKTNQGEESPTECWIEPSWAKSMSSSLPGSPDSGVSSRPPTRDLATIQTMMDNLEMQSGLGGNLESTADLGYNTSSSADFKSVPSHSDSDVEPQLVSSDTKKILPCQPKIMPRPPAANDSNRRGRRTISSTRFTRKSAKLPS